MWHDGEDWVVAESAEEAQRIVIELTGIHPEESPVEDWGPVDDDKVLAFNHQDGRPVERRTAAEWVALNGKGHWASVNY